MPDASHLAYRHGCAGAGGMGKTSRLGSILAAENPAHVFAFDPAGQIASLLAAPLCHRRDQLGSLVGHDAVCYSARDNPDRAAAFDQFCRDVWSLCAALPGRKFLVVDELQEYVDPNTMPPGFWKIIDTGRWHRLDLAFTCQSLNRIHNGVRVQLTHVSAFNHTDERAAGFLLENGFPARELAALGRGQYLTRQLIPPSPILACDDRAGVRKPLPGQEKSKSPVLEQIFGKRTR